VEETPAVGSELKRKLDYSDLQVTPDDGRRYELVRGDLLVTPSPSLQHQRISRELLFQLAAYFHERFLGEVFYAPTDLILTGHDVFVPDLVVTTDPGSPSGRGIEKPPLLVVEILSPSTARVDRGLKAQRYAELGVAHYWLVDPERRTLECHRLEHGAFHLLVEGQGDTVLAHPTWDGLSIVLARLWR
jgi:Uma2 family endonuclease